VELSVEEQQEVAADRDANVAGDDASPSFGARAPPPCMFMLHLLTTAAHVCDQGPQLSRRPLLQWVPRPTCPRHLRSRVRRRPRLPSVPITLTGVRIPLRHHCTH
jgi:hypothetical protein